MFRRFTLIAALSLCLVFRILAAEDEADSSPGQTQTLKTADGVDFSAYRVGPPGARIGILLIPEAGVGAPVQEWADWLGENDFRVIVPDLYNGKVPESHEQAQALQAGLKQREANAKYLASLVALKAPGRKIVVMGWGFAGTQAMQAAIIGSMHVHGVVSYEAHPLTETRLLSELKVPVLALFARKEAAVPTTEVHSFEAAMRRLKKRLVVGYYDRPAADAVDDHYSDASAHAIWKDTQAFFKRYVK